MNLINKAWTQSVLVSLSMVLILASFVAEAKVYKWTDKNGKVHYSDKPFDQNSEEIELKKPISQQKQQKAKADAQKIIQQQNRRLSNQFEQEKELKQQQAQKEQDQREYEAACKEAKDGLKTLQMQRPVYELKDNGERVFYSEERRKKEIAQLNEIIATHCSE